MSDARKEPGVPADGESPDGESPDGGPLDPGGYEGPLAGRMGEELVGRTVGGCRILRELGRGAAGSVYLAEQLSLKRKVAMKILAPHLARRPEVLERFVREAQAAAQLVDGNIVQVYDVGSDGGAHYIRIEFVDGETVQDMLDREGRIPVARAVEITRQAAMGLARAEESGLVHRDIKPENLMVSTRGEVKIADFGLAKRVGGAGGEESSITHDGTVVGTPYYMSPEQASDLEVDTRSDIYSLGATLYHMVTGQPPYSGSNYMSVLKKHLVEPLVPARERYAACPEEVSRLIDRMMAKDVSVRFQSAREVLVAIGGIKKILRAGLRRSVPKPAAAETPERNRRRYRRIAADFVASVAERTAAPDVAAELAARIRDISEGGLYVETERLFAVGAMVEVGFRLSDATPPVRVLGIVRWLRETGEETGMGIEFVQIPRVAAEPVQRFLSEGESAGALGRLTRTGLHQRLLRFYYESRGDSASLAEIAGKVGSSVSLVRPAVRELEQHGLARVEQGEVAFLPAEDGALRRRIDTWILQERARED